MNAPIPSHSSRPAGDVTCEVRLPVLNNVCETLQHGEVKEIILVEPPPTSLFRGDGSNTLQWANFYPSLRTIAIGEQHAKYPTHGDVHAGFLAEVFKSPSITVDVVGSPSISAFQLGQDVVICINDHSRLLKTVSAPNSTTEHAKELQRILEGYRDAVEKALLLASHTKGKVIALVDTVPQSFVYQLVSEQYSDNQLLSRSTHQLLPVINGYVDGKNYIVRIEPLKKNPYCQVPSTTGAAPESFREDIFKMAEMYRQAIELASIQAQKSGGAVLLQADGESQKFVTKLLGMLHHVVDPNKSVGEAIRKATKESASGRYIYNANSGTRYFFPDDLKHIAEKAVITLPADLSPAASEELLIEHHKQLEMTLGELSRFLNSRNRMGHREGKFFLVNRLTGETIDQSDTLSRYADKIADVYDTVAASKNWSEDQYRVQIEIGDIVYELTSVSHPDFHRINLSSPRFVDHVSKALRSGSSKIDLGEDFSTPLNAQEFGYFRTNSRGEREFFVTSGDPALHTLATWLLSSEGEKALSSDAQPSTIMFADYITAYKPETPLTFEPHPTNFIRRFGHLEAKSFVIEFGRVGHSPERWVLEENVWAPGRWPERNTDTVRRLQDSLHAFELSIFVKDFKDAQYSLFATLLKSMRDSSVNLAPPYQWVSIPGLTEDSVCLDNIRIRRFINGKRSDLMRFDEWDYARLAPTMEMLGDLMAAAIVAQLPHLPRRDIIIDKVPGKPTISGITFLSPGESFCQSSRAKNLKEYLKEVVPILYGNHIARWLAPIGYRDALSENKGWKQAQNILIDSCINRIGQRLLELTQTSESPGTSPRTRITDEMDRIINQRQSEIPSWRPPVLDIATFLPFSRHLLHLKKSQIQSLCKAIKGATLQELNLIEKIAPAPRQGADMQLWEDVDTCATAVSSLIEGHLAEATRLKDATDGLRMLAKNLTLLTAPERAWFITVLDVNLRISELKKKKTLGIVVADAFRKASGERQFYELIVEKAPVIDLSYETIAACHRAISGLRQSYKELDPTDPKAIQLAGGLRKLRPIGQIILGDTSR